MSASSPEIDLDPLPYIAAYRAACQAGIPPHDVAAIIHRAIRRATGLPPIKARQWFGYHLLAHEGTQITITL
jgi:hypothetical protein